MQKPILGESLVFLSNRKKALRLEPGKNVGVAEIDLIEEVRTG